MELLEGEDLEQLVERRGPLPVHEAVWYVLETLEALGEAHARGIVHRDLKPSNLFLSRSGDRSRVKVLDFGISKLERGMEAPQVSLTTTKSMLGSPGYMSPEQVRSSKNVDARTDIWSVGVILYELLQGSQAFVGETLGDVFAKIREEPLPSIRTVRPDVPEALDRILARCLERDRSQRFSSALELAQALRPYASPSGVDTARTLNVRDTPASVRRALTVQTRTDWSTRYPQTRSGILPIVLGLLVSVIAGVALAVAIYKRTEGGPNAALASATQPAEPGAAGGVVLPPAIPAPSVLTVPSSSPSGDPLAVVPAKSASAKPSSQPPRSTGRDPGTKPPTTTGKDPEGEKAGGSDKTGPKPNAYDPDDLGI
jgi:serine/threonine-protein kinase